MVNPIRRVEFEHDEAESALAQLRQITDAYTPPDWACNNYRALFDALRTFEQDMHQHVHKKNNLLFQAAIGLEQSKAEAG